MPVKVHTQNLMWNRQVSEEAQRYSNQNIKCICVLSLKQIQAICMKLPTVISKFAVSPIIKET